MLILADIAALTAKFAVYKQAVVVVKLEFTGYLVAYCSAFVMIILADIAALTAKLAVHKQATTQVAAVLKLGFTEYLVA